MERTAFSISRYVSLLFFVSRLIQLSVLPSFKYSIIVNTAFLSAVTVLPSISGVGRPLSNNKDTPRRSLD